MLIGAWGNLVNRVVNLSQKYGITSAKAVPHLLEERTKADPDLDFQTFFDQIEERYLANFNLQGYLQDWYRLVQKANELITKEEPWKKYKDPATQEEAIQVLQFLLYVIKNLTLLSAPFLTQGYQKLKGILGIEVLQSIDTSSNLSREVLKAAFDLQEFSVQLAPEILYQRVED